MPFPGYRDYQNTGSNWLPELPSHWTKTRLKFLSTFMVSGGTPTTGDETLWGGEIPWVSPKDMKAAAIFKTQDYLTKEGVGSSATKIVPAQTLLMVVRSGILRHSIPVALSGVEVAINQDIKAIGFVDNVEPAYVRYFIEGLQSDLIARWGKIGCTVESIETEYFANEEFPVPPECEQLAIVAFLNRETARIDALIDKKRRLLELFEEKLQSAVTSSIDSRHGKTTRLKFHVDLLPGYAFPSAEFSPDPDDVRLLRGINVSTIGIRWTETVRWPKDDTHHYSKFSLEAGDVVFGMDRPWVGPGVRVAQISHQDLPCLLLQRVARLRADAELRGGYLELLLRSRHFFAYFEPDLTGVSVPHISGEQILSYPFELPSLADQDSAIDEARRLRSETERASTSISEAIKKLAEYRSAMITAAVTGKIDVRALAEKKDAAE